ncbi:MAG: flagellar basal body-associated FliL family protein [Firmicutes bacterium]|nr:flagellar basal body-associated FliL family protein [Bacillota bacterium]
MTFKRSLIIILVIALLLIGSASYYEFVFVPGLHAPPSAATLESWQYPVDKITTNLQQQGVIQAQFTLQAGSTAVVTELGQRNAQVDDAVIGVLHGLSSAQIMAPGGRELLKAKVKQAINAFLTTGKIRTVYIDSMIVQ